MCSYISLFWSRPRQATTYSFVFFLEQKEKGVVNAHQVIYAEKRVSTQDVLFIRIRVREILTKVEVAIILEGTSNLFSTVIDMVLHKTKTTMMVNLPVTTL